VVVASDGPGNLRLGCAHHLIAKHPQGANDIRARSSCSACTKESASTVESAAAVN
jgi:hypothetical protein